MAKPITESILTELKEWLLCRESDIALETEDFGDLQEVFKEIVGREAE